VGDAVIVAVGDGAAVGGADGDAVHAAAPSATTAATAARPRTPRRYGTSTRRQPVRRSAGTGPA
jgi:hypothetical protein